MGSAAHVSVLFELAADAPFLACAIGPAIPCSGCAEFRNGPQDSRSNHRSAIAHDYRLSYSR